MRWEETVDLPELEADRAGVTHDKELAHQTSSILWPT
jgi:hypothetical protein